MIRDNERVFHPGPAVGCSGAARPPSSRLQYTLEPDIAPIDPIEMRVLATCPQSALGAGQAPSATRQPHRPAYAALPPHGMYCGPLQRGQPTASSSSTPTDLRGGWHQQRQRRRAGRQRAAVVARCVAAFYDEPMLDSPVYRHEACRLVASAGSLHQRFLLRQKMPAAL